MTCKAIICHGPGHQSKTRCQIKWRHSVHAAFYGSARQFACWKGDKICSGFFDEPPDPAVDETKQYVNSKSSADWSSYFYQYTNRLAHLYFLRVLNDIPAYLIFVYFLNDKDMNGPETEAEWIAALKVMKKYLGIGRNRLSKYIGDIFVDVKDLT